MNVGAPFTGALFFIADFLIAKISLRNREDRKAVETMKEEGARITPIERICADFSTKYLPDSLNFYCLFYASGFIKFLILTVNLICVPVLNPGDQPNHHNSISRFRCSCFHPFKSAKSTLSAFPSKPYP